MNKGGAWMSQCTRRHQRTTYRVGSLLLPCVSWGVNSVIRLGSKHLYPLSHSLHCGPGVCWLKRFLLRYHRLESTWILIISSMGLGLSSPWVAAGSWLSGDSESCVHLVSQTQSHTRAQDPLEHNSHSSFPRAEHCLTSLMVVS